MRKLRDILYDTSDIFIVLFILAFAALVIWSRIDAILAYPSAGADGAFTARAGAETDGADAETPTDEPPSGEPSNEPPSEPGDASEGSGETGAPTPGGTDAPTEYSVYISYGETAAQIAQKLLDVKLISSNNEFYDALIDADAAKRLQAGTFIIPAGASCAEIVKILTGR